MSDPFLYRHFTNYRAFVDFRKVQDRQYLKDQEYVRLFADYVQALRMFRRAIEEQDYLFDGRRIDQEVARKKEQDRIDRIQGPYRRGIEEPMNTPRTPAEQVKKPDFFKLPPESGIDKINRLRRDFEYCAKRLIDYNPSIRLPEATRDSSSRGYIKDGVTAQFYGDEEKNIEYIEQAIETFRKECKKFWNDFVDASVDDKNRLQIPMVERLVRAQALGFDSEEIDAMYREIFTRAKGIQE